MRRRAWPTLLLVAYAALLVLGAWPEAVRPALMDAPAAIADGLLRVAGMRSGVGVFEPGRERIVLVQRNDCIRVRGLRGDAAPVRLEPREGGLPHRRLPPRHPASRVDAAQSAASRQCAREPGGGR